MRRPVRGSIGEPDGQHPPHSGVSLEKKMGALHNMHACQHHLLDGPRGCALLGDGRRQSSAKARSFPVSQCWHAHTNVPPRHPKGSQLHGVRADGPQLQDRKSSSRIIHECSQLKQRQIGSACLLFWESVRCALLCHTHCQRARARAIDLPIRGTRIPYNI